jgi:hypothetical protein
MPPARRIPLVTCAKRAIREALKPTQPAANRPRVVSLPFHADTGGAHKGRALRRGGTG